MDSRLKPDTRWIFYSPARLLLFKNPTNTNNTNTIRNNKLMPIQISPNPIKQKNKEKQRAEAATASPIQEGGNTILYTLVFVQKFVSSSKKKEKNLYIPSLPFMAAPPILSPFRQSARRTLASTGLASGCPLKTKGGLYHQELTNQAQIQKNKKIFHG